MSPFFESSGRERMSPVELKILSQRAAVVQKPEQVSVVRASALQAQHARVLVLLDLLVHARLYTVLVLAVDQRNLVVVARVAREVREWIQVQQRESLRADLRERDRAPGERQVRFGIEHGDGRTREIADSLRRRGHQPGLRRRVSIMQPLVVDGEIRSVPCDQVGNLQRAAKRRQPGNAVVTRLGSILPGERKRTRIQVGIVQSESQTSVVQRSHSAAVVSERL